MDLFSSPHPLAPPTSEGAKRSWLRLLRSRRVGTATFHRLMAEHDSNAEAALDALPRIAAAAGIEDYTPCPPEVAEREMAAGRRAGARLLCFGAPGYPVALADLADAPPLLWARGNPGISAHPAIALVGARNASSLGLRMARALAGGLGRAEFAVVSGLARGIDTAAHEAALDSGTIAVVAGGVDVIYPRENAKLTGYIAERGLILSEMPPGLQPQARHFPRRNRLISGLARAVVVVEAAVRSGSLITARDALDQGREVMAVPGHPFDARAAGCNLLLRDGATLVRGAEDIIAALGPASTPASGRNAPRNAAPTQQKPGMPAASAPKPAASGEPAPLRSRILSLLGPAPVAEDQLLRDLALPGQRVAEALLALELDGAIVRQPGGMLARTG
ncbi:DNA-processing protein DprA [Tropicimonas sp.]|uniref:DNA-processing protein DprA n=1 Tax=Tropicimonas sp. TaxID=2067044 RepID=UPI003A8C0B86